MIKKRLGVAVLAIIGMASLPAVSQATIISGTYAFSAPNAGSVNPFAGSFDITFDNSINITTDTTTGLSNVVLPFVLSSGMSAYQYYNSAASYVDVLVVGGTQNTVLAISGSTNDYFLVIENVSTPNPVLTRVAYHTTAGEFLSDIQGGSIAFRSTASVPEPGTLALLGLSLAGLAVSRRRQH